MQVSRLYPVSSFIDEYMSISSYSPVSKPPPSRSPWQANNKKALNNQGLFIMLCECCLLHHSASSHDGITLSVYLRARR